MGRSGAQNAPANYTLRVGYQPYFAEAWSGSIIRAAHLDIAFLPIGTHVAYSIGLKGAGVLVDALRRGDIDIAYLGLMPTLTATQGDPPSNLRIIAVSSISQILCDVLLGRRGAPEGAPVPATLQWLRNKRIAVPQGTCADLFLTDLLDQNKIHAVTIVDQSPDLVATALRLGTLDAAAVWEPFAAQLVQKGLAVRLLSGQDTGQTDATFIVARESLLREHPHVLRGWLLAESAAQHILASRTERTRTLALVQSQTRNFDTATLLHVIDRMQTEPGATRFPFVVTPAVQVLLDHAAARMIDSGTLPRRALRSDTVADSLARDIQDHSMAVQQVSRR